MATACTIDFDNSDNGSFQLICDKDSNIKWIHVLTSKGDVTYLYSGDTYSYSDMYYNWYIIAEAVSSSSPDNEYKREYKIIGVFTKNSEYLVGIFLTANGYNKLKMNYGEITTIRIADIESTKINNDYSCIFNTASDIDVENASTTFIEINGKVLNYSLSGNVAYINDNTGRMQCDEGIIKYIFNLSTDVISDSNKSINSNYEISLGNMVIIFNSVTNEICAVIVLNNRDKTIYTYSINTHNIYQRPNLTSPGSTTGFQINEVDIQGYYTVNISYPDGADIDVTNTEV